MFHGNFFFVKYVGNRVRPTTYALLDFFSNGVKLSFKAKALKRKSNAFVTPSPLALFSQHTVASFGYLITVMEFLAYSQFTFVHIPPVILRYQL